MGSTKTLVMSSVKIMLMSTGILTIAILLFTSSSSIPTTILTSTTTTSSNLFSLFSTLRSWLRPPYLYLLIIAAIAFLHHNHHHHENHHAPPPPPSKSMMMSSHHHHHDIHSNNNNNDVISLRADHVQYSPPYDVVSVTDHDHNVVGEFKSSYDYNDVVSVKDVEVEVVGKFADVEKRKSTIEFDHDVYVDESTVVEPSTWTTPPPLTRQVPVKKVLSERPPASSRFSQHRRLAKAAPAEGGKALRVHKPKKHDTLESTWKAITEGRHVPLNRHLKKSDTWENHPRQIDLLDDSSPFPKTAVKKSETFKERTNYMTPPHHVAPSRLKKEPSLGHDELNRRVEAFINKFNEDMRLQRQESMQQFMEMINRAA